MTLEEALERAIAILRDARLRGNRTIDLVEVRGLELALDEHREREMKVKQARAAIRAAAEQLRGQP